MIAGNCGCPKRPTCEQHDHAGPEALCIGHGHITLTIPGLDQNPPCIWCNGPTRRTGACFTCQACGSTTSC